MKVYKWLYYVTYLKDELYTLRVFPADNLYDCPQFKEIAAFNGVLINVYREKNVQKLTLTYEENSIERHVQ